jgi:hypothetical protein
MRSISTWRLWLRNTRIRNTFHGFFEMVADDFVTMEELEDFANSTPGVNGSTKKGEDWSDYLVERIQQVRERENRPSIRAHIGIAADTIEPTVKAVEKLAEAGAFRDRLPGAGPDLPGAAGEVRTG